MRQIAISLGLAALVAIYLLRSHDRHSARHAGRERASGWGCRHITRRAGRSGATRSLACGPTFASCAKLQTDLPILAATFSRFPTAISSSVAPRTADYWRRFPCEETGRVRVSGRIRRWAPRSKASALPSRLSRRREQVVRLLEPAVGPVVHNPTRGMFLLPNAERYGSFLDQWGAIYERFGVPAEIGLAQAVIESGLNGRVAITSPGPRVLSMAAPELELT